MFSLDGLLGSAFLKCLHLLDNLTSREKVEFHVVKMWKGILCPEAKCKGNSHHTGMCGRIRLDH